MTALYTNIYPTLKALDATNTAAIVAAAAQAAEWRPEMIARFCTIIGADPTEVRNIIWQARASKDAGQPWFNT